MNGCETIGIRRRSFDKSLTGIVGFPLEFGNGRKQRLSMDGRESKNIDIEWIYLQVIQLKNRRTPLYPSLNFLTKKNEAGGS